MTLSFLLFDMDGVLLHPRGYHQSLQDSVKKIGQALGATHTELSSDQIATFEALNVTNEWDSLAICTALILIHIWEFNGDIRLDNNLIQNRAISSSIPNFDAFLTAFSTDSDLPGHAAFQFLVNEYPWLDSDQKSHLAEILLTCRDIFHSPTLALHQEKVLGSQVFQDSYKLQPKFNQDSYLLNYDRPVMTRKQIRSLRLWLNQPVHTAGIMTNRPSATPAGHLSPPEAELGAKLVELDDLPILGSGLLSWFAIKELYQSEYIFLKPNPVHALGLIQMCIGKPKYKALKIAADLWQDNAIPEEWGTVDGAKVVIFEDSVKGLQCGIAARDLLASIGVSIQLFLVGVSNNPIKIAALEKYSDMIVPDINDIHWQFL